MTVLVSRPAKGRIRVTLPYRPHGLNYELLKEICGERTRPRWNPRDRVFEVARGHLAVLLSGLTARFGEVKLDAEYYETETCTASCWEAKNDSVVDCTCGCLGERHGGGRPEVPRDATVIVDRGYPCGEVAITGRWTARSYDVVTEFAKTSDGLVLVHKRLSRVA